MKSTTSVLFAVLAIVLATIAISAQELTPISQIQGETYRSALVGKQVTTRGIVTGLQKKGFFMQTPDAEIDANPKTSEGIYVFTSQDAPNVSIGDLVEVSGTVSEFVPKNENYFLPITEIVRPNIKPISKNNPLPAPILLSKTDPNPLGQIDQMEKYEGMRVRVDQLTVVAPTGGYTNEKSGETKSDGVFFGIVSGNQRPFREPGVEILTRIVDKLPPTVPTFDMNPELLRIDSDALNGGTPIDVTSGATLSNVVGIVDYTRKAYTILLDPMNPPSVEGNKTFTPVAAANEREVTVGSFNLENFFDDEVNSPTVDKEQVLSKEYFAKRLNKASLAIRKVLASPDVLGVIEVENLIVLQKLAAKINADAIAEGAPDPKYQAFLQDGNDIRGIDSGFLVKTSKITVKETVQLAKDEKLETPGAADDAFLFDRPPFLLRAEVADAKSGQPYAFTVIVNHFKSYRGIDDPKDGDRVRNKRRLEAEWLAKFISEREIVNLSERIIVCGDFNSFQYNDGFNDLIGILKGKSDPNVITPSTTAYQTGLVDLVDKIALQTRYSYVFGGSAQVLDHVLVNRPALERAVKFGYARLDADFPLVYANDANRPERISDHDGAVFFMSLDELKSQGPNPSPQTPTPTVSN